MMRGFLDVAEMPAAALSAVAERDIRRVLPPELTFGAESYRHMSVALDPNQRAAWLWFKDSAPRSFDPALLADLAHARDAMTSLLARAARAEAPIKFVVCGSRIPGVYNLGGDLALFADCIRRQDREALRNYAHKCCEMVWHGYVAMNQPVIIIGLMQGDALGGGFECALSFNVLIAEKRARFGMPEVLFNMFPGMGAYSLLSRKVGPVKAEEMILSGKIYTADELHALGIVDVVVEDGAGEDAVRDYIARNMRRHSTIQAVHDVRRRVGGLTLQELLDVTDRWVDEAMRLDDGSMRRMERLLGAQGRRAAVAA
jgi:DSF synthase